MDAPARQPVNMQSGALRIRLHLQKAFAQSMGTMRHRGAGLFCLSLLALLQFAPSASASTNDEISGLPIRDLLNRKESPLSNEKRWSLLSWVSSTGKDTLEGWAPANAYPAVHGAYWTPDSFSDAGAGDAAELTFAKGYSGEGRYVSLWLNMPDPDHEQSGYQLTWESVGSSKYKISLIKWSKGTSTVLNSSAPTAIPDGSVMAIADIGRAVQAWQGTAGSLSMVLTANDSTYSSGYSGIQGSGNATLSLKFQTGHLLGEAIKEVGVLDNLERNEVPIKASKWSKASWAEEIGGVWSGEVYLGFGGLGLASAYWNAATFSDVGNGDTVAARIGSVTIPEKAGEYIGLWLNMPNPGSARSGYEVRLVGSTGGYSAELSKWVSGSRSVLASAPISAKKGDTIALTQKGGGLTFWRDAGSGFSPVLLAFDATYSSGYAGIETYGPEGTLNTFRAGSL